MSTFVARSLQHSPDHDSFMPPGIRSRNSRPREGVASDDETVKVWDGAGGALLHTLSGHAAAVYGCAISGDGALIVSASGDQAVKVWDGASGALLRTLAGHTAWVMGCAISGDGALIVSASDDQTVKVWDSRSGKCRATLHVDGPLSSCAIYGSCDLIIAGGLRGVYFLRLVR